MNDDIREILREHGRLAIDVTSLAEDADLYQAGMTSHASVNVMLALEGKFDIEFPDRMLKRNVFVSIASIRLPRSTSSRPDAEPSEAHTNRTGSPCKKRTTPRGRRRNTSTPSGESPRKWPGRPPTRSTVRRDFHTRPSTR
jgi:acyl carrier protein